MDPVPLSRHAHDRTEGDELVYKLNDRPPALLAFFAALQHLLAIFVPIVTPPLIVCGALDLDIEVTSEIVSMSLLISGIATAIQVKGFGPVGSRLLSIQGTSFTFVSTLIAIGKTGGLPVIFGVSMAGSFVEMILSRFIPVVRRLITPLVSGIVVTLIGLSLVKVGIDNCAGGAVARAAGEYGAIKHLALAGLVMAVIVLMNRSRHPLLRMSSIVVGLGCGYLAAAGMGMVSWQAMGDLAWGMCPRPMRYGVDIDLAALLPMALLYMVTSFETIGDITATSMISREPVEGPIYVRRISNGVLADGVNSLLAGLFNTFPNTTFSQNNGIIQLTGMASRYVGFWIAGMLVLLGLSPRVAGVFALMPAAVLGGGTLLMFGTVAAAGIKIMTIEPLDRRAMLIIALSMGLGLGVIMVPDVLSGLPRQVQLIFNSGVVTGGFAAIVGSLLLRRKT